MNAAPVETKNRASLTAVERLVYLHWAYQQSQQESVRLDWRRSKCELRSARGADAALSNVSVPAPHQKSAARNQAANKSPLGNLNQPEHR